MSQKLPDWFQELVEANVSTGTKLVVLCRILGVQQEEVYSVVPAEEILMVNQTAAEALEVGIRARLFKKPEAALSALTQIAIETKRKILEDTQERPDLRLKVADDVLDRVLGKATQTMQIASVSVTADAKDLASIDRDLDLTMKRIASIEDSTKKLTGVVKSITKTPLLRANGINN